MNTDYLIKMANEIAAFYEAYPDAAQAQKEVADHLARFWDARMRRQIIDYVGEQQGAGLSPLVIDAVKQLKH